MAGFDDCRSSMVMVMLRWWLESFVLPLPLALFPENYLFMYVCMYPSPSLSLVRAEMAD